MEIGALCIVLYCIVWQHDPLNQQTQTTPPPPSTLLWCLPALRLTAPVRLCTHFYWVESSPGLAVPCCPSPPDASAWWHSTAWRLSSPYVAAAHRNRQLKIKMVYCHVASTWNLHVVAYILHTYIPSDTQDKCMHTIAKKQYIRHRH